jgi:sugar O-acyltransferase (sialic acid O-acetyltransferase NeuD family)
MQKSIAVVGDDGILTRQAMELAKMVGYTDIQRIDTIPATAEDVFIAFDDSQERVALLAVADSKRLVNLIHPTASVSPTAKLMTNILVGAQAIIGSNAVVSKGVVQNALSAIEHDNRIGEFTFLGTGAILCGYVTTGEFVFVGGGATVQPGLTIGSHTIIGTGAVLVRDATENSTYVGNPARLINGVPGRS